MKMCNLNLVQAITGQAIVVSLYEVVEELTLIRVLNTKPMTIDGQGHTFRSNIKKCNLYNF